MGNVVPFKKSIKDSTVVQFDSIPDGFYCRVVGCFAKAELSIEYVNEEDGTTVFKHYCGEHAR